jgi:hypothetical protein
LDAGKKYLAFYLSRIEKDDDNEERSNVYYRLKEILLRKNISSQVVVKSKINNPNFNYYLPNICIAVLSKLGGIPWRLYRPIKGDLVIGIGAYRTGDSNKFLGNAFSFKNDGSFQEFDAFQETSIESLGQSFYRVISQYTKEQKAERLIIHFYKEMNKAEERALLNTLTKLNIDTPYIIISVNETESKDYVIFDLDFDGCMPKSGTILKISKNEYLLCNNTRYSRMTGAKIESYPFPIKVKFTKTNYSNIRDEGVILELIDQVYQFSRMYWKSVRQRNKPVTIEYSELVAEMVSHFSSGSLPDTQASRTSLWFL